MEKEIRNLGNIQIRAVDGESSRHIEGYALMFDTQSEYIGFYETIDRGAVTQEMVDACDVFATFNHDMNKIFARSNMGKGSLTLTVDDTGLKYEFDAPNTALGDELIEYLKRGDIDKSSFAFYIDPDDISVVKFTQQANTNRDITSTVFTSMIDDDVYIDIHKSIKFVNEGKKLHLTIFKGE